MPQQPVASSGPSASVAAAFVPPASLPTSAGRWLTEAWSWLARVFGAIAPDPGEYSGIVVCRLKSGVKINVLSTAGLEVVFASPVVEGLVYSRITNAEVSETAIAVLRGQCEYLFPEVLYAVKAFTANSPDPGYQWHHTVLETFNSWASSNEGAGTTVAVIDSAFNLTLDHLKNRASHGAYWDNAGTTFKIDLKTFPVETMNNHGTCCAALAVGANVLHYGSGVAPRSGFAPFAIGDPSNKSSQSRLARALGMALDPAKHKMGGSPAKVISCSIAPGQDSRGGVPLQADLKDALDLAQTRDALVIWAVANVPTARVADDQPANHPAVLNVGAVNAALLGQGAEPPQVAAAVGDSYVVGSDSTGAPVWIALPNASSFAAPLVAGVAALVRAKSPKRTASEVRSLILGTKHVNPSKVPLANADDSVASA